MTRYEYDGEQDLIERVSPLGASSGGHRTRWALDELGRPTVETQLSSASEEPDLVTRYTYDRRDNVVTVADPRGTAGQRESELRWRFEYDRAGRRTAAVENPDGENTTQDNIESNLVTRTVYDSHDNVVFEIDPRGNATTFEFDGRDRLLARTDAEGRETSYEDFPNGLVKAMTSPRGNTGGGDGHFQTRYTYNQNDELETQSLPQAPDQYGPRDRVMRYVRNAVGDPVTITDYRGNQLTNEFLDSGELAATSRPSH